MYIDGLGVPSGHAKSIQVYFSMVESPLIESPRIESPVFQKLVIESLVVESLAFQIKALFRG